MGNAKRKTLTLESLKKLHPCNFLKIEFLHSTSNKNKGPNRSYGKDLLSVPSLLIASTQTNESNPAAKGCRKSS